MVISSFFTTYCWETGFHPTVPAMLLPSTNVTVPLSHLAGASSDPDVERSGVAQPRMRAVDTKLIIILIFMART